MALQFKFNNEKIITDAKFFMVPEFVEIWKYDRSKTKTKANKLLYFIFLLCDIGEDNPLANVDTNDREVEAKFRAYHDKKKKFTKREVELLEAAIPMYIDLNMTVEERLLTVFDKKAAELKKMLEQTTPETVRNVDNGVVTFVSNSRIITSALNKLSVIRKNRASIVATIKKEAMSEKVRGQLALSPLVKGLINIEMNETI